MLGFGGKMSEYNPGPGKIRGFFRVSVILPGGKSEMIGVTIGHWSDAGHAFGVDERHECRVSGRCHWVPDKIPSSRLVSFEIPGAAASKGMAGGAAEPHVKVEGNSDIGHPPGPGNPFGGPYEPLDPGGLMSVVAPAGVKEGEKFGVEVPGRGVLPLTVPIGLKAGQPFTFQYPPLPGGMVVAVPETVTKGQSFSVRLPDGKSVIDVTVPGGNLKSCPEDDSKRCISFPIPGGENRREEEETPPTPPSSRIVSFTCHASIRAPGGRGVMPLPARRCCVPRALPA